MLVDTRLLGQLVTLDLEVIVASSEHAVVPECRLFCLFEFPVDDMCRDLTGNACRKCDQAFRVLLQKFVVDPRLIVEALGETRGYQAV